MAAFAQFGSDLDQVTQRQIARGSRLVEILKQGQYEPMPIAKQILIIYVGTNGFVDHIPVEAIKKYEEELIAFVEAKAPDLFDEILERREITDEIKGKINKILEDFNANFK